MAANITELILAKDFAEREEHLRKMEGTKRPAKVQKRGYEVGMLPKAVKRAKLAGEPDSPPAMQRISCSATFAVDEEGKISTKEGARKITVYLRETKRSAREIYVPMATGDTMKIRLCSKDVWVMERIREDDARALLKASVLSDRLPLFTEM